MIIAAFETRLTIVLAAGLVAAVVGSARASVILDDALPGQDPKITASLRRSLYDAGEELVSMNADQLIDPKSLAGARLLVLPSARSVPLTALPAIDQFLKSGGKLIACGLPLCEDHVVKSDGKWMTAASIEERIGQTKPAKILATFKGAEEVAKWKRATNSEKPDTIESVDAALHVAMPELIGWDTVWREFNQPFPQDHLLTCFRAKGTKGTEQLAVEWEEIDGSRWIATVPLTETWQNFALSPQAFAPWQPPKGRGGPGDVLNVRNAKHFAVGLAFSHTAIARGAHEYWFADLGTAPTPIAPAGANATIPHIEGLCPSYQFFPINGASRVRTPENQAIVVPANFKAPSTNLIGLHPRPGGAGFGKNRPQRWQPLLEALSDKNEHRGTIAALIIPTTGPRVGSAWACFTPSDPAFYARTDVSQMITDVARAMRRGAFLREGGASVYTQFEDLPVTVGTRSIRINDGTAGELMLKTVITQPGKNEPVYNKEWPLSAPGTSVSERWKPRDWPADGQFFTITTELRADNMLVDRLVQRLYPYRIKQESPNFVSIASGRFEFHGKPWRPNGVNYMPSSGIGLDDGEIFEHWIGSAGYDPDIVDRDLRRIRAMNMNAISVFIYHKSLAAWNLIDLLRRCDQYGLKVNLSLRPGTPIDFDWDDWKEIIEQQRLAKIDTIFAYDLAWEWTHWDRAYQQKHYIAAWRKWVTKKYGSLAAAEKTWTIKAPRATDGELDVPETKQLFDDGDWRKLAIDYRAFLDGFIAGRYGGARDLVRSVDPNHAVSFRMNIAGDPTARDLNNLAYDFWGLRGGAVDIFEPEAYGRIGDWEQIKPGRFTVDYARLCDPNKPVMWAEVGVNNWNRASRSAPDSKLVFQADYARDFYRMLRESGSDGVFWWWYPGGYRVNEQSDFGIVNPDGTDRPATKVIREEGSKFINAPEPSPPNVVIEVDRDGDARGIFGIYISVMDQYWKAIDSGKAPGLRWAKEPGAN